MKRLITKIKCNCEKYIIHFKKSNYNFVKLHFGTNSISVVLLFIVCLILAIKYDVLDWDYMKGLNHDLSFFIGFFSILLGVGFYKFWRLGEKSLYSFHYVDS